MIKQLLIRSPYLRFKSQLIRKAIDTLLYRMLGHDKRIASFKDQCKGKPLLVIGNGPSLNNTPLDKFIGVNSIGMNKIDLIFSKVRWRPTFIICVNGIVMEQNKEYFQKTDIPVLLDYKAFYLRIKGNAINYFRTTLGWDFSKDFSEKVGNGPTVTYHALQFAYYLGANPVIIFGVDHSFKFEGKKMEYVKSEGADVNHFDPNYFANGSLWGLPDLEGSEVVYQKVKNAFEADGRKVFDATIGGKLQIFEKISLAEALSICDTSINKEELTTIN